MILLRISFKYGVYLSNSTLSSELFEDSMLSTHSSIPKFYLSINQSLAAFLNSLKASAKPLKSSGIFLPPKSIITINAITNHSFNPIDWNIIYWHLLWLDFTRLFFLTLNSFRKSLLDFFDLFNCLPACFSKSSHYFATKKK